MIKLKDSDLQIEVQNRAQAAALLQATSQQQQEALARAQQAGK